MRHFRRRSASLLAIAAVFFAMAAVSEAGGRGSRKKLPPPKIPYTAIASVDPSAMTITVKPMNSTATGTKTYKFTARTAIMVNGKPGTLADLAPGQQIHVGLGSSDTVAEELKVTPPPADPEYSHGGAKAKE